MPLKIYADFEHNVKGVMSNDSDNASHNEKYQAHILCIFVYKLFAFTINLVNQLLFIGEKCSL